MSFTSTAVVCSRARGVFRVPWPRCVVFTQDAQTWCCGDLPGSFYPYNYGGRRAYEETNGHAYCRAGRMYFAWARSVCPSAMLVEFRKLFLKRFGHNSFSPSAGCQFAGIPARLRRTYCMYSPLSPFLRFINLTFYGGTGGGNPVFSVSSGGGGSSASKRA